jgi:hypothetical protein
MTNQMNKTNRPSSITLISILAILAGLLSFYFLLGVDIQAVGVLNFAFIALGGIVFLLCGIGFWLMKKWAYYAYLVFAILNQIFLLIMGRWNIMALLIPVVVVYVGYKHLSKMS